MRTIPLHTSTHLDLFTNTCKQSDFSRFVQLSCLSIHKHASTTHETHFINSLTTLFCSPFWYCYGTKARWSKVKRMKITTTMIEIPCGGRCPHAVLLRPLGPWSARGPIPPFQVSFFPPTQMISACENPKKKKEKWGCLKKRNLPPPPPPPNIFLSFHCSQFSIFVTRRSQFKSVAFTSFISHLFRKSSICPYMFFSPVYRVSCVLLRLQYIVFFFFFSTGCSSGSG